MTRVQRPHALADPVERPLEILQMPRRLPDRSRLAVHRLVRLLALSQLLLADRNTQVRGYVIAPVLDLVSPVVRPDVLQACTDPVGGLVDAQPDDLLRPLPAVVQLLQPSVQETAPVRLQRPSPG
ncbi:hypothetical protein AMK15_17330 [Streptomyces sp. MJM1172]|nr:hypothetical protein AMK15_17330 [Streptomyces sp. MJM1172]